MSDPSTSIAAATLGVRAVLDRNNIPRHKHSSVVAEVLGLSRAQAYRKAAGVSQWTVDELRAICARFGEPIAAVVEDDAAVDAHFVAGPLRIPCLAWIARPGRPYLPGLVAVLRESGLEVCHEISEGGGARLHLVVLSPSRRASEVDRDASKRKR
jgi:hypothetical protein